MPIATAQVPQNLSPTRGKWRAYVVCTLDGNVMSTLAPARACALRAQRGNMASFMRLKGRSAAGLAPTTMQCATCARASASHCTSVKALTCCIDLAVVAMLHQLEANARAATFKSVTLQPMRNGTSLDLRHSMRSHAHRVAQWPARTPHAVLAPAFAAGQALPYSASASPLVLREYSIRSVRSEEAMRSSSSMRR